MQPPAPFWIATMDSEHTQSTAFGATPEGALTALVELWIERHCANTEARMSFPWTRKEEIRFGRAEIGKAFMLGNHDGFYYPESLDGANPRLASTWDALAMRYGVDINARPSTPEERFAAAVRQTIEQEGPDLAVDRLQAFLVRWARVQGNRGLLDEAAVAVGGEG